MNKYILLLSIVSLVGCVSQTKVCDNTDGLLSDSAFVIVDTPNSGNRVDSEFVVKGCSRTFESTVNWELYNRQGDVIAQGYTNGGGVDGYAPFSFDVTYTVDETQFGILQVYEEDVSEGEGFPPIQNKIPIILRK